tara:strand:+ start:714 stop:1463 length:750 start_codon:yes stop_codon:yes gene_type:complete
MFDVTVEVFKGERHFRVQEFSSVIPENRNITIASASDLRLDTEKTYLILKIEKSASGPESHVYFKKCIDKVITILSLVYSPRLFSSLVYNGPVYLDSLARENKAFFIEGKLQRVPEVEFNSLEINLFTLKGYSESFSNAKFELMTKFFAKAINSEPDEVQFMNYYIILEIFPMGEKQGIKYVEDYLVAQTGKDLIEIREIYRTNKISKIRNNLMHHGRFPVHDNEFSLTLKALESLVIFLFNAFLMVKV